MVDFVIYLMGENVVLLVANVDFKVVDIMEDVRHVHSKNDIEH